MTHAFDNRHPASFAARFARTFALCFPALAASQPASAQATVEMLDTCFITAPDNAPVLEQECGYVVVPENPDRSDSPDIKLGFLRLSARTEDPQEPLFMLAGGPGETFIMPDTLLLFSDLFLGPILDDRDVVFIDQRGTAHAVPRLDCPSFYGLSWSIYEQGLDDAQSLEVGREALAACIADARDSGVDLDQYNSVRIAADIDMARQALGYDRIVLYGASYGAQLGQHFMRDFPDSLVSVVLDGANSLSSTSWAEDRVRDADVALERLAALCEADAKCGAAYDVRAMVDQAMALFDEGPIEASFRDADGTEFPVTVTASDLASTIFESQTGQIGIRTLPLILDTILADGRTSAASILGELKGETLLASRDAAPEGGAVLMHMAVVCSDDPVASAEDMIVEPDATTFARLFGQTILEEYLELCRAVDVASLPDDTDVDVTTDVPTLVLAGALDVRTPAFRSQLVAETLPHATFVLFPEGTHVQLGEINQCAGSILIAFLADPDAEMDTNCMADMPRRGFVLPDGTMSID